jgi:hypothetical protein
LVLVYLKYLSIGTSLFLTIRYKCKHCSKLLYTVHLGAIIHLHVAFSGTETHPSEQTKLASAIEAASNMALVGYSSSEDSMDGDSAK